MRPILIWAAALSVAAAASAASAQTPPSPRTPPPPAARPGEPPAPAGAGRFAPGADGPRRGFRGPRSTPEERAKRRADLFARMDGDRNGQVTFEEYRAFIEARRLERQKRQFERFSGGQAAVTLDQLNARALERERAMQRRFEGRRGGRGPGPGGPGGV